MSNQKKLIVMAITFTLILILSSSYSLLRSTKVGQNNYVINVGDLKVNFQDTKTNALTASNMYPMTDEEGREVEQELVFTVKNEGTVKAYYNVSIEETSTEPEFKTVIKYLVKKNTDDYNTPTILSENKYIDSNAILEANEEVTYHVKVYLAESADNTYMGKTFRAKIHIESSQESNYAKDVIKSKLVKYEVSSKEDFSGGLVAVNTNGELYNEKDSNQKIREYRYSGLNVNNYINFNNEIWRIIGLFKDEEGNELVKIVRNELIKENDFPTTYTAEGTSFKIRYTSSGDYAYWNNPTTGTNSNDWTTAGLMYWLNSKGTDTSDPGYLNKIRTQDMIHETKWNLGNIVYSTDTPATAYEHEKGSVACSSSCSGGDIWSGNSATWTGKIALMYPSDYGFSTDSSNWNSNMNKWNSTQLSTTWLKEGHTTYEVFLSPISTPSNNVASWSGAGHVNLNNSNNSGGVRPTLYLNSNVVITSGNGESGSPYQLELN